MGINQTLLILFSLTFSSLCFAAKLPVSTLQLTSNFEEIETLTSQSSWEKYYKEFYVFIVAKAGQEITPKEVVFPLVEIAIKEKTEAWQSKDVIGIFGRFASERLYFDRLFDVIFGEDSSIEKSEAHRILELNFVDIPAYVSSVKHYRSFGTPWTASPVFKFRH